MSSKKMIALKDLFSDAGSSNKRLFLDFIIKEWLLFASAIGFLITSVFFKNIPEISSAELEVILIITVLFITVKGIENSGLIISLARRLEAGKFVGVKLITATFFLSMLITNDVSLIVIVPLTLILENKRKDVLIILEALSANAGSALTPIGNPQNLFIYWFYGITPTNFISAIWVFSFSFLIILILLSIFLGTNKVIPANEAKGVDKHGKFYVLFFFLILTVVLRILPLWVVAFVPLYSLVWDRRSLKIDYGLIFTFLFFFLLAGNLKLLFDSSLENSGHVFILSAFISQMISNVPTALLLAKFTDKWQALLWGTNVGGFGNIIGSLANLIAYKFYISAKGEKNILSFTFKFLALGYAFFFVGVLLYFALF